MATKKKKPAHLIESSPKKKQTNYRDTDDYNYIENIDTGSYGMKSAGREETYPETARRRSTGTVDSENSRYSPENRSGNDARKAETVREKKAVLKKAKRKRPLLTGAIIVISLIAVVAAVGAIYVSAKLDKISYADKNGGIVGFLSGKNGSANGEMIALEREDGVDVIESSEAPEGDVFKDKDVVNVLFIGSDAAADSSDLGRADCVMLCSLNQKTGDIKLISFERGISVKFDIYPYSDILTHTFAYGGPELTLDTIRKYFLLDIIGYVHVDYDAFITGIDALGGVDIELTKREAQGLNGEIKTNSIASTRVHEGWNHLDGFDAKQYCRLRFIDSDWKRIERQRNTIQAAMNAARNLSLKELDSVANTVLPLIDTNLSKRELSSLILSAPKFIKATAGQMTVPLHEEGDPRCVCIFEDETERIKQFIYG